MDMSFEHIDPLLVDTRKVEIELLLEEDFLWFVFILSLLNCIETIGNIQNSISKSDTISNCSGAVLRYYFDF